MSAQVKTPDASDFSALPHSATTLPLSAVVPSPTPTPQSVRILTPPRDDYAEDEDYFWGARPGDPLLPRNMDDNDSDNGIDPELEEMRPQTPLIRPLRASSYRRSPSYRRSASRASRASGLSRPQLSNMRSQSRNSIFSRRSGRESLAESVGDHKKVRGVELFIAYVAFSFLGACVLLAWNCVIVAGRYFKARLEGSPYEASFAAFVASTFTLGNLIFLWLANSNQQGANMSRRIQYSILALLAVVGVLIGTTMIEQIDPTFFFVLLISCTIVLAISASYVQNAVVALCSHFGPFYLSAVLSGQGLVGVAVAMMQLVSAYTAAKALSRSEEADGSFLPRLPPHQTFFNRGNTFAPTLDPAVLRSAFTFFLAVAFFSGICLVAHEILIRLTLYHRVVHIPDPAELEEMKEFAPKLSTIEKKVRKLGVSMFWVFAVSLSVFPAITSSILSNSGTLGPVWSEPHLFIPIVFTLYAVGDWLGRVVTQIKCFTFTDWRLLMSASAARTIFIPLLLACNVQAVPGSVPYIKNDWIFLIIMFLFSFTNGYVSSLVFLAAVVEPSLDEEEIEVAATCLAFYLTAGLAAGSFIGFPIRAAICHCNPFV